MNLLIIIPTFNESQNIEPLIRTTFHMTSISLDPHILVVDDNSPDGTAAIVEKLIRSQFTDRLFLMVRNRKSGLGTAYIEGFQWGLQHGYQFLAEMDADFSHRPEYLPQMMLQTEQYECIIGSRYVPGGGVKGWGPLRKIISKGGSVYAGIILGLPIQDLTGGFNIWKRTVLEAIDLSSVKSEGYAFQIELKYRAFKKGFRLHEVPIIFEDRRQGKSKMSKAIILEAIYRVWQLKMIV